MSATGGIIAEYKKTRLNGFNEERSVDRDLHYQVRGME
jgi:hypothetical protein